MQQIENRSSTVLSANEISLDRQAFTNACLPAIIRLAVEIGEKKTTLDENCPVFAVLRILIGIHPYKAEDYTRPQQDQAIHLARLLRKSLELADEVCQLDNEPAIAYAAGYLAGETCRASLYGTDESTAANDLSQYYISNGLHCSPPEAFRAGFTYRRDELRKVHNVD